MNKVVTAEKTLLRYPELWVGRRQVVSNGFWFVDIPRCSSTSIRAQLGKRFGRAHGRTAAQLRKGKGMPYFADHVTAQAMRKALPKGAWERLFTFTLVRNPWDRLVSLYHHRVKERDLPAELPFKDFVAGLEKPRYMLSGRFHSSPVYFMSMVDFLCDREDRLMVDFVGRYESRKEDLGRIGEKIGFPELGDFRMQDTTSGRNRHYSEEYDDRTRQLVATFYADDIERFGYRFED